MGEGELVAHLRGAHGCCGLRSACGRSGHLRGSRRRCDDHGEGDDQLRSESARHVHVPRAAPDNRRGLFLVKAQAWDPVHKRVLEQPDQRHGLADDRLGERRPLEQDRMVLIAKRVARRNVF